MSRVLLDTGPLVAIMDRRDQYHEWAKAQWAEIPAPLLTCEAVLAEACFLVRHLAGGPAAILELVTRGVVSAPFKLEAQADAIRRLLVRYASVPMSLADACLVRMAEQIPRIRVLTLDRDFQLYRIHGRQIVPALMPTDR
jgi:uncharacterized protein